MNRFQDKPAGGVVRQRDEVEGPVLYWYAPSSLVGRLFGSLFLGGWLCGWAAGEYSVASELLSGKAPTFLIGWLAAWTAGGCAAMYAFWSMVRPSRPESLLLGDRELVYDPGWRVPPLTEMSQATSDGRNPLSRGRRVVVPREDVSRFVLDRVGERQRLTFDHGAKRVEVGACLGEPEREWLFGVLEQWRQRGRL
ncbi:MAG: hypothetical protein U0835_01070 [Isosphaeraceae bacterium]